MADFDGERGRKNELIENVCAVSPGNAHFDYFSSNCSFAWNFDVKSQYCWAHLIRDIRFLEKHPNKKVRRWVGKLLDRTRRLFKAWPGPSLLPPETPSNATAISGKAA